MPVPPSRQIVSEGELRQLFNGNQYWEKVQAGEFTQLLRRDRHLGVAKPRLPFCTHSQSAVYFDSQSQPIAIVHQYVLPDGTIGASGRPDPKMVRVDNVTYILAPPST